MEAATHPPVPARKPLRGLKIGVVTSDRRDKSRTVVVGFLTRHPKYGKYVRRRSTFQVHDQANDSRHGDLVEIVGCRPLSKTKSWRLVRVVRRAAEAVVATGTAGQ
jgi:small subunit ribosomal protein S17